jgi:zinc protease
MKKYISLLFATVFLTTLATAQIDRSKQPKPGPAPTINLQKPQTFKLNNGMEVLVVENNKLPRVRVQLLLDNPMHASGEKAGVASLFASMMGNGTTSISKDEFNEEIDYLGANISFGSESAFASSLSKYFPRILELMADAIKNPLLTEEEFQKQKDLLLENLRSQEKSVTNVSGRVTAALLYGSKHPKGEFTTIEKVEKLSLNDVKNFYSDYFSPSNAYLVVVGDVKKNNVERLVNTHFADWNASVVPNISYTTPQNVQYTQVNFIDMPNAVQSEITVQNLVDLKMSDPDYFAALVANKILGGGGEGRLFLNLREDKGWTYGSYSSIGADKDITRFAATASVRNAVTDSAVVELIREIRYMTKNEVDRQKLVNTKAKFTGDFVLALERPETIANYALQTKTQDLSKDFYKNYLKNINAVTAADVKRAADKYFKDENLRIVIVGKGSEVIPSLKNLKGPSGKPIPINYFDKFGNPIPEPDYNKQLDPSLTAETVINKYIDAIGGRDKVKAVETILYQASAEMQGMKLGLEMKNTTKSQSSLVVSVGGNPMQKIIFDGEKGYIMAQGQRIDYTEDQNKAALVESQPFMELKATNATLEGIEAVDGKDAYVVSFGDSKSAFYDVETGLKVKETTTQSQNGNEVTTSTNYSNYNEVQGIKFPHTISQSFGPQELKFTVTAIKINEGVTDADFE